MKWVVRLAAITVSPAIAVLLGGVVARQWSFPLPGGFREGTPMGLMAFAIVFIAVTVGGIWGGFAASNRIARRGL